MQQISPAQVAEWASQQAQQPVLLDVREGWEVQTACARHNPNRTMKQCFCF